MEKKVKPASTPTAYQPQKPGLLDLQEMIQERSVLENAIRVRVGPGVYTYVRLPGGGVARLGEEPPSKKFKAADPVA